MLFRSCTITLALAVIHAFLERRHPEPWKPLVVVAAVIGAPLLLAPRQVAEAAASLLQAAFFP